MKKIYLCSLFVLLGFSGVAQAIINLPEWISPAQRLIVGGAAQSAWKMMIEEVNQYPCEESYFWMNAVPSFTLAIQFRHLMPQVEGELNIDFRTVDVDSLASVRAWLIEEIGRLDQFLHVLSVAPESYLSRQYFDILLDLLVCTMMAFQLSRYDTDAYLSDYYFSYYKKIKEAICARMQAMRNRAEASSTSTTAEPDNAGNDGMDMNVVGLRESFEQALENFQMNAVDPSAVAYLAGCH